MEATKENQEPNKPKVKRKKKSSSSNVTSLATVSGPYAAPESMKAMKPLQPVQTMQTMQPKPDLVVTVDLTTGSCQEREPAPAPAPKPKKKKKAKKKKSKIPIDDTDLDAPPPFATKEKKKEPKSSKPSAAALAMHKKWQEAADAMSKPGVSAKLVLNKHNAKRLVFDHLRDAFRPMNITDLHKSLRAVVPPPVLKSCLDEMVATQDDVHGGDENDDKIRNSGSHPCEALLMKVGRNSNTTLYYVDYSKLPNNGNGLFPEERERLFGSLDQSSTELTSLQRSLNCTKENTRRLLSELTNEDANVALTTEERARIVRQETIDQLRSVAVDKKTIERAKRRVEQCSKEWRKRRRLCMDFLDTMDECTEGTISVKKCLSGNGPIEIESDEAAVKAAIAMASRRLGMGYNRSSRQSMGHSSLPPLKKRDKSRQPVLVGVTLDKKGCVCRVYDDHKVTAS